MSTGRSFASMLLAAAMATAAAGQNVEDWRQLETDHFLLVGNASNNAIKRVAERLEEFRAAVVTLMPLLMPEFEESEETGTTVMVFRHDRAFDPFKPTGSPNIAGYFSPGRFRNYIALTGDRDFERAIYHEYIHQVAAQPRHWRPWMTEGVAELYSTIQVRDGGKKVRVGTVIPEHLGILQEGYIPLERLFAEAPDYQGDPDRVQLFYAESWAVLHYLKFGNTELGDQLPLFNRALASGNDVPGSVQLAFGMDIGELQRDFLIYVRNSLTLRAVEYSLADPIEEIDAPDTVDISKGEAAFHQGDLLFHIGRFDDARTYLEEATEAVPDFEPAQTAMFLLAEQEGDAEEASRHLERAASLPDAGYVPRLLWAQRALTGGGDAADLEQAETYLRSVVEMRPEMPDGYFWLGQALLQQPEGREEATGVLEQAVRLDPTDSPTAFAYAQALWLNGDDAEAVEVLTATYPRTVDPILRRQIEDLQDRIQNQIAREARVTEPRPLPGDRPEGTPELVRRSDRPTAPDTSGPGFVLERTVPEGMLQVEGDLTELACRDGLRIIVSNGNDTREFLTTTPETLEFTSYNPDVQGGIGCGPIDPPARVRVTYRPIEETEDADHAGTPVRVEFLP